MMFFLPSLPPTFIKHSLHLQLPILPYLIPLYHHLTPPISFLSAITHYKPHGLSSSYNSQPQFLPSITLHSRHSIPLLPLIKYFPRFIHSSLITHRPTNTTTLLTFYYSTQSSHSLLFNQPQPFHLQTLQKTTTPTLNHISFIRLIKHTRPNAMSHAPAKIHNILTSTKFHIPDSNQILITIPFLLQTHVSHALLPFISP